MVTNEPTRLERDIAIIEETLRAMIEIGPLWQILSEEFQQSSVGATLL